MLSEEEKRLIGGSDAAAIAGVHPNKRPIDVFRRVLEGYEEPAGKPARRGLLMEPVIRAMAAEDYGLSLLGPRKLRDPKRDYIRASLDDVNQAADTEEVVELKSVSPWAAQDYGEGEDEAPLHHLCQVQFYMDKAGLPRAHIFALIGVDDLRHYVIRADADVQAMLAEAVDRFYLDHIKTGRPPPPDHSESYQEYLANKFPSDNGTLIPKTAQLEDLTRALRLAKEAKADAERAEAEARNRILATIGEASGVSGLFTYKWTRGRQVTDWDAVAAEAKVPLEVIEKHSRRTPFRVLRLDRKG